ncbi:unnamed protein product [Cuscuta europaea]|uniref:Uncharacterized protein n=1 Tax=Cuscuta europaea TaxID=41803 RepID=A0A9P0ZSX8_CUSEU|nr:unnamed protein product [Cuscuta europaea]
MKLPPLRQPNTAPLPQQQVFHFHQQLQFQRYLGSVGCPSNNGMQQIMRPGQSTSGSGYMDIQKKHGLSIGIRADREPIRRTPAEDLC